MRYLFRRKGSLSSRVLMVLVLGLGTLTLGSNAFYLGDQAQEPREHQDTDPELHTDRSKLLDLLYRISNYLDQPTPRAPSPGGHVQSLSGYTLPDSDEHAFSKKSDMSVLPPWNEFCRMMKITNCFHSQH